MQISKEDEAALRERTKKITGGIRRAAALGGITNRTAQNILAFESVRQETYDAFVKGIELAEQADELAKITNSFKAQGRHHQMAAA